MRDALGSNVVVLGGAGFIGSHLVERFVGAGARVTVIDGLLEGTGGREGNLDSVRSAIEFIPSRVEESSGLAALLASADLVIDGMGWTAHRLALVDPLRDLELNAASHLYVLQAIGQGWPGRIIYLGSRGQYGNPACEVITEESPMTPLDVQGANKVAAESYFRVFSNWKGLAVASVRIPNCFGARQMVEGHDIGLVGGVIRDILLRGTAEVYGSGRRRPLVYVEDVADAVFKLAVKGFHGFEAYNLAGYDVAIEELVREVIRATGKGKCSSAELPTEIKAIDVGVARFSDAKLRHVLAYQQVRDFPAAIRATVHYFQESL